MKTQPKKLSARLNIIWTIAKKDILDGLQNKVILSLVLGVLFMLLMPSLLAWMLEPPYATILVYDPGSSQLVSQLEEDKAFQVERFPSFESFETTVSDLGFGIGIEYGLLVPADFDQRLAAGEKLTVEVYAPWSYRFKLPELSQQIEQQFSTVVGTVVRVNYEGNILYPPPGSSLMLGLTTYLPSIIILMVGISMMPQLFFEEKQTKTIDALLVSPASEGQMVTGKALVGMFYILVTAIVAFGLNWSRVVHWELVLLFVVCGGLFGVSIGLVLGIFFERQQEIFGWSMLVLVMLIAAIFLKILALDLPEFVQTLLPWVPSVAMTEIIISSFLREIVWESVLSNAGIVLGFSLVLYILVIWRLRRSDR